jgi:hypothetical protein
MCAHVHTRVCVRVCVCALSRASKLFQSVQIDNLSILVPIQMDVCVCVCVSGHNSGTPGAISTKLGTHIATCMCKNLMYVLYIFRKEDGVGVREFG